MLLKGKNIQLRALEPSDLNFLYVIENDTNLWHVSNTQTPFSKHILKQYLANAHQDIYEAKQLRLTIQTTKVIGFIDLYNFNPQHKRAGVGIVISKENQNKNFASKALNILINYAFNTLNLHQIYADITYDNHKSIALFEKMGFLQTGIKKDWNFNHGVFKDVLIYQRFKKLD